MNLYRNTANIKAALFIAGFIMIVGLILYSQNIVKQLREDNREIVKLYAELVADAAAQEGDENLDFIFRNIIQNIRFPVIQTNLDGEPVSWRNVGTADKPDRLTSIQRTMDRQNEPIALVYIGPESGDTLIFGYLHYGDSRLINRLIWLPFQGIAAVTLFILLGFIGFTVIRNNEKRHIWIGMAKETAHQLGTPVSALMGWVDRLKNNPEDVNNIAEEMDKDLRRLNQISGRFSDMSKGPSPEKINLHMLVQEVSDYLSRRIPTSVDIKVINRVDEKVYLKLRVNLFAWVIENMIRNSLDAIGANEGSIEIWNVEESNRVTLYLKDTGKGIPKKDWKNVFRPGFSTKSHGWGLGLSLANRIVEDINGGRIFILDSSPSSGTVIGIHFNT
jgi:two-component sensor histidine kinase